MIGKICFNKNFSNTIEEYESKLIRPTQKLVNEVIITNLLYPKFGVNEIFAAPNLGNFERLSILTYHPI